jgi:hypothetical protein
MRSFKHLAITLTAVVAAVAAGWAWQAGAAGGESGYVAVTPCRALDTRADSRVGTLGTLGQDSTGFVNLSACGVPTNATSVAVNATSLNASAATFITLWGSGGRPATSTLNPAPGFPAIPNGVIVPTSGSSIQAYNRFGGVDLILDVTGYFVGLNLTTPTTSTPATTSTVPTASVGVEITGYGPGSTITTVSGTVTNNAGRELDLRVDLTCPGGTVEIDYVYGITSGQTLGWSVICDGSFTSGATATWVEV